jgi:hypothetical protein
MAKTYLTGLQSNVVSSYDKTKTTVQGRAFQKTISSLLAVGPPLTKFIDVQTDTGIAPGGPMYLSPNGRLFLISSIVGGLATLVLYNFNTTTGVYSFVGKLAVTLPNQAATVHSLRGFKVTDAGTTGWKIFIGTTGSVLQNGGTFMVNAVALADFVPSGFATLPMATGTSQKAVYFLQDPSAAGANYVATSLAAMVLPWQSANAGINTKVFVHNGVSAVHQYYAYDWSIAPQVANTQTNATISVAAPGVVTTGSAHGFSALDQVIFTAGTVPTGLALNTVYFVVAAGLTTTQFSVSLTSGGAAITTTGSAGSGVTVMRGFGICTNTFSLKTGNLPALAGTLLNANCEFHAVPSHTTNSGFDCDFFASTTNLYLGKFSDLTSGATTWPSLVTSNVLGSGSDVTTPTPVFATYSNECDLALFSTNTSSFIAKKVLNSQLTLAFAGLSNTYMEGSSAATGAFALATIVGMESRLGWLLISGNTIGQRGVIAMDLRSDASFDYSSVISPVQTISAGAVLKYINSIEQLFDLTDSLTFEIRGAATSGDAVFNSATGGWSTIMTAADLSAYALPAAYQIKALFQIATNAANTPAQIIDFEITAQLLGEFSDYFAGDNQHTTQNGISPAYTAFEQTRLFSVVPSTLYFESRDLNGNVVQTANTTANPSSFTMSVDGGTTWTAWSALTNAVGTLVRYLWATPPGLTVVNSIRETA